MQVPEMARAPSLGSDLEFVSISVGHRVVGKEMLKGILMTLEYRETRWLPNVSERIVDSKNSNITGKEQESRRPGSIFAAGRNPSLRQAEPPRIPFKLRV